MSSSKFSSRPPARKRPVICKAGPPGSDPPMPDQPPIQINAFVAVADDDPAGPVKMQEVFTLSWSTKESLFYGQSAPRGDRLELWLRPTGIAATWNAVLNVWDPWRTPETFYYYGLYANPNEPWGIPTFGDVHISLRDFRTLQLKE